jgi:hypothetical protein
VPSTSIASSRLLGRLARQRKNTRRSTTSSAAMIGRLAGSASSWMLRIHAALRNRDAAIQ